SAHPAEAGGLSAAERVKRALLLGLLLATFACRTPAPPPAIDPQLAACVPEDSSALIGLDLDALRASPIGPKIPPSFAGTRYLLIASRGQTVLPISTCAGPQRHAPSPLLSAAEPLAARAPVWAVIRGGATLPLAGNLANLNTLFQDPAQ